MNIQKQNGVVILIPTAEDLEDIAATLRVVEELLAQDEKKFVVNLNALEIIFSLQIGTLVALQVLCKEHAAELKVAGASQRVKELLHMVGLDKTLALHLTWEDAVLSFGEREPSGVNQQEHSPGGPRAG